jgi:glutathione S-transferase
MAITLFGETYWFSPYMFPCFVALREKSIPFEVAIVPLQDGAQRAEDYAAKSLTARVPSLDHDGFVVAESTAIVEYIEETFGAPKHAPVLPVSPEERARARQLMSWLRSDDTALIRQERPTSSLFFDRAKTPLDGKAKATADKLFAVAGRLLDANGDAGRGPEARLFSTWSVADADLTVMVMRLVANGDEVPERLRAYAEHQWARPSVNEFVSHERPTFVPYG